jgi:hypothetical protein
VSDTDLYRLLGGPYEPPALHVGDRTRCLYRNAEVVITSWTSARIPWPQGRAVGCSGRPGLLITDALVRAIRTESAEAIKFWFCVSTPTVWHWRRALGISHWGTEGSRRLQRRCSEAGAAKLRGQKLSPAEVERRRQTALERGFRPGDRWGDSHWTPAQQALLGALSDAEVAARIGRTAAAIRAKRLRLRIPRRWSGEESKN